MTYAELVEADRIAQEAKKTSPGVWIDPYFLMDFHICEQHRKTYVGLIEVWDYCGVCDNKLGISNGA